MSTPTYKSLLQGTTSWFIREQGVGIEIIFSDYAPPEDKTPSEGTWAFYILLSEQMFPNDWADFTTIRDGEGKERPTSKIAQLATTQEVLSEPYYSRKEGRRIEQVKLGFEVNDPLATLATVKTTAIQLVRKILTAYPTRQNVSAYSGKWGTMDKFYTARNGHLVHIEDNVPLQDPEWSRDPSKSTK